MQSIDIKNDKTIFNNPYKTNVMSTEAQFYLLDDNKIFKQYYIDDNSTEYIKHKIDILHHLNTSTKIHKLSNLVYPETLIYTNKKFIGYIMKYVNGITLSLFLEDKLTPTEDKIVYLKKIGQLLESMEKIRQNNTSYNIYLNDIHSSNFMIDDNNKLKVIDLDGSTLKKYRYFPAYYNSEKLNISKYYEPNYNTEIFGYNMMLLSFLLGINASRIQLNKFHEILEYLNICGIDNELCSYLEKTYSLDNNINPYNNLDSLKYKDNIDMNKVRKIIIK